RCQGSTRAIERARTACSRRRIMRKQCIECRQLLARSRPLTASEMSAVFGGCTNVGGPCRADKDCCSEPSRETPAHTRLFTAGSCTTTPTPATAGASTPPTEATLSDVTLRPFPQTSRTRWRRLDVPGREGGAHRAPQAGGGWTRSFHRRGWT